jgi:hypothetical protein
MVIEENVTLPIAIIGGREDAMPVIVCPHCKRGSDFAVDGLCCMNNHRVRITTITSN